MMSYNVLIESHTQQVLSALAQLQLGQPFVPSSRFHKDFACFQEFQPIIIQALSEISQIISVRLNHLSD